MESSKFNGLIIPKVPETVSDPEFKRFLDDNQKVLSSLLKLLKTPDSNVLTADMVTYNVLSYGAAGNGVADDTTAIQTVLDMISGDGGGSIYFPAGTYKITQELTYSGVGLHVIGDSKQSTIINIDGAVWGFNITGSNGSIEKLRLQGAAAIGGIKIDSGYDWGFRDVICSGINAVGAIHYHLLDCSHIFMSNVYAGDAANATGLKIESNTKNTGVFSFDGGCMFGANASCKIGLHIKCTSNVIDSLSFSGVYFGGIDQAKKIEGPSNRTFTFAACHYEKFGSGNIVDIYDNVSFFSMQGCSLVGDDNPDSGVWFHTGGVYVGVNIGNLEFTHLGLNAICVKVETPSNLIDGNVTGLLYSISPEDLQTLDDGGAFKYPGTQQSVELETYKLAGAVLDVLTDPKLLLGWVNPSNGGTEIDLSPAGNNATYMASTGFTQASHKRQGNAWILGFDGNDQGIDAGDKSDFTFGNGVADQAFSAGVLALLGGSVNQILMGKWDDTPASEKREWLVYQDSNNQIHFYLGDEVNDKFPHVTTDAAYDNWHLLSVSYNGGGGATAADGMKIYIDGKAVAVTKTNDVSYVAMTNTTAHLQIGIYKNIAFPFTTFMGLSFLTKEEISVLNMYRLYIKIRGFYHL